MPREPITREGAMEDGDYASARAFDILRKYVQRHARDVAEHKAS